jgi:hypothetical protein
MRAQTQIQTQTQHKHKHKHSIKSFTTRWGESNLAAKALQKLKKHKYKNHQRAPINEIVTMVDTLIQEAKIADEDQKKSFL